MATGRSTKLTGQAGEFLVAAELARRGWVATTFTGNVPHYDIIASNDRGKHLSIQVKTIRSSSWQFSDVSQFYEIKFHGKRQSIGRKKRCPFPGLVCVLVQLTEYGDDRFYICTWEQLRDAVIKSHQHYLDRWSGVRPHNPRSLHNALKPTQITKLKDNWRLFETLIG